MLSSQDPSLLSNVGATTAKAQSHSNDFHSFWCGQIAPSATREALVNFFGSFPGFVDLYYIKASRSAFVNFSDDRAAEEAALHFHGQIFQGCRLICRPRKHKMLMAESSMTNPHATMSMAKSTGPSLYAAPGPTSWMLFATPTPLATLQTYPSMPAMMPEHTTAAISPAATFGGPMPRGPVRYFIVKCLEGRDVELSIRHGVWAPQTRIAPILDQAFKSSSEVFLIFSINKSGEFIGFCRMKSPVGTAKGQSLTWSILDSSRKNPLDGMFEVEWIMIQRLPFSAVRGLTNPWNHNKDVKVSRDGTELEPSVGHQLIMQFYHFRETPLAQQFPLPKRLLEFVQPYPAAIHSS